MTLPAQYRKMVSTVTDEGQLIVELVTADMPEPKDDQVLIRVEAAPINPSDHAVMFGWSSMGQARSEDGKLVAPVEDAGMRIMKGRIGKPQPLGNEGAGTVVAAGASDAAQALLGQTVAAMGGGMYAEYRLVHVNQCLPLGDGHTARDGASSFVNPMTALSFPETMKMEGHTAMIHTAAASNLGQMLVKICNADDVPLVNIVRRQEQADLLKSIGAKYVVDSSQDSFMADLVDAILATKATVAFDATGGGRLASDILTAMEIAASRTPGAYSVYGSTHHKQVYLYGGLDVSPTILTRGYGMAWGVGGWLLPNFLAKAGMDVALRLRQRVAKELTTTFASAYTDEISLDEALAPDIVAQYNAKKTGQKFLIVP